MQVEYIKYLMNTISQHPYISAFAGVGALLSASYITIKKILYPYARKKTVLFIKDVINDETLHEDATNAIIKVAQNLSNSKAKRDAVINSLADILYDEQTTKILYNTVNGFIGSKEFADSTEKYIVTITQNPLIYDHAIQLLNKIVSDENLFNSLKDKFLNLLQQVIIDDNLRKSLGKYIVKLFNEDETRNQLVVLLHNILTDQQIMNAVNKNINYYLDDTYTWKQIIKLLTETADTMLKDDSVKHSAMAALSEITENNDVRQNMATSGHRILMKMIMPSRLEQWYYGDKNNNGNNNGNNNEKK